MFNLTNEELYKYINEDLPYLDLTTHTLNPQKQSLKKVK